MNIDKLKIGDSVTLNEGEQQSAREHLERIAVARCAFETAARMLRDAKMDLWKWLWAAHPELKGAQGSIAADGSVVTVSDIEREK